MRNGPPLRLMAPLWQLVKGLVKEPTPQLFRFSNTSFKTLPTDQRIGEEAHDAISKGRYYPVRIGDVVQDRYQIVGKLGFGVGSTVWLANDFHHAAKHQKVKQLVLKEHNGGSAVALKIFTNDHQNREEINIYNHLISVQSKHPGRRYLRSALDTFTLQGPKGEHQCIVHKPMLENTQELLGRNPSHRFTEDLLKIFLQLLLSALDYLHTDAHLIHTGKPWFRN